MKRIIYGIFMIVASIIVIGLSLQMTVKSAYADFPTQTLNTIVKEKQELHKLNRSQENTNVFDESYNNDLYNEEATKTNISKEEIFIEQYDILKEENRGEIKKEPETTIQQIEKPVKGLSEKQKETVAEEMALRGSIGRLIIPDGEINVALFKNAYGDGSVQKIVDNEDSAAYITWYTKTIIADHVHQGFSGIKRAVPGITKAYIDCGTYTKTLICYNQFVGYNKGSYLSDINGNVSVDFNEPGFCMYTCNRDGTITITLWKSQ